MPVFKEDPTKDDVVVPSPVRPKIEPVQYEGITVDTQYIPNSAMLAWAQGSNWTVDSYYSQVLGANSEPTPHALNREKVYQQYRRIRGMVLKVDDALSFSQDPTNRIMTVTGGGWTFPFLTPQQGDMFTAGIGDGRVGLFTISEPPIRKTILRDSVYEVRWTMVSELTTQVHEDLNWKSVETFYYSHANMMGGCGPFISLEEKERSDSYSKFYGEIIKRYLTDFFSNEHSTLLVPDQWMKTYDHFVVSTFLKVVSTTEDLKVRKIKQLNVQGAQVMNAPTLFDALLRHDPAKLYGSTQRAHLVSTKHLRGSVTLQAIGYTGIDRLVYPIEAPTDIDSQYDHRQYFTPTGISFKEGRPRRPIPNAPLLTQVERNLPFFQPVPHDIELEAGKEWMRPADIHPVVIDDYYVFSRFFYENSPQGQSRLELLVNQLIKGEALNLKALDRLLESVYDWDNLERFYYHPVVLILLRHVLR